MVDKGILGETMIIGIITSRPGIIIEGGLRVETNTTAMAGIIVERGTREITIIGPLILPDDIIKRIILKTTAITIPQREIPKIGTNIPLSEITVVIAIPQIDLVTIITPNREHPSHIGHRPAARERMDTAINAETVTILSENVPKQSVSNAKSTAIWHLFVENPCIVQSAQNPIPITSEALVPVRVEVVKRTQPNIFGLFPRID